jgi:hypothetical protein
MPAVRRRQACLIKEEIGKSPGPWFRGNFLLRQADSLPSRKTSLFQVFNSLFGRLGKFRKT